MSLRNVLAVLEDHPDRMWSTFYAAVDLADREHARLTLVKTYETNQLYTWCAPFCIGAGYIPADESPEVHAERLLARAAEFVPMEIPVTTLMLGVDTEKDLRRLVECGAYDALVTDARFLRRARKLRRECARGGIDALGVTATAQAEPGAVAPQATAPMACAPDAVQRRHRR